MAIKSNRSRYSASLGNACLVLVCGWFVYAGLAQPLREKYVRTLADLGNPDADGVYRLELPEGWSEGGPKVDRLVPLADRSFVFLDDLLIPVQSSERSEWSGESKWGWHRIEGGNLLLDLPERAESLAPTTRLEIEIMPSPVPRRRNLVVAWGVLALCGAWWASTATRQLFFSPWPILVLAGLSPLLVIGSFFVQPMSAWEWFEGASRPAETIRFWHDMAPGAFLVWAIAGCVADRRGWNESTTRPWWDARVADLLPWATIAALAWTFIMLIGWGPGRPVAVDQTGYSAPFGAAAAQGDAQEYEIGSNAFAATGVLPEWNQRRPINTVWSSLWMQVGGMNPVTFLCIQMLFGGWALGRLVRETTAWFGIRSAVLVLAMCWGMSRFFMATQLSEMLGLVCGALGMAWLMIGVREQRRGIVLAGILVMTLSQAARPGALFVLPLLGLAWAVTSGRPTWLGRGGWLALAAGVVLLGISINPILNAVYGTGQNITGSNFAYTFAGLASGGSWREVQIELSDQLEALPDEAAQAKFLYSVGWQRLWEDPRIFIGQMVHGWTRFAVDAPAALSWMLVQASVGGAVWARGVFAGLWGGLGVVAVWRWWWLDNRALRWILAAIVLGTFLSIPFVYLDGGIRVLVGAWPALFVVLGLSLAKSGRSQADSELVGATPHSRLIMLEIAAVGLIVIAMTVGPYGVHAVFDGGVATRVGDDLSLSEMHIGETRTVTVSFAGPPLWFEENSQAAEGGGYDAKAFQRAIQRGLLPPVDPLLTAMQTKPTLFQTCFDADAQIQWYVFADRIAPLEPGEAIEVEVLAVQPPVGRLIRSGD